MAGLADRYVLVCLRCNFHVCLSLSCHGLWTWTFHQTCCGGDRAKPQFLLCFPDCCYLHSLFFFFYFSFPYSPATRLLLTSPSGPSGCIGETHGQPTANGTDSWDTSLFTWDLSDLRGGTWPLKSFLAKLQFSSHSFFVKEDLACICMWRCIFAVCHHLPNAGCGSLARAFTCPQLVWTFIGQADKDTLWWYEIGYSL